jgi:hypothetical protein
MPVDNYINTPFAVDGSITPIPDAIQVDGTVNFDTGYPIGYQIPQGSPGYLPMERDKMNYLFNLITTIQQQWQQIGTPPFITSTANLGTPFPYAQNARAFLDGVAYQSLINGNTDTPPSANWAVSNPFTGLVYQTGMIMLNMSSTPFTGFVNVNGSTLGSTSSGATYAGSQYANIYANWWDNCSFPSGNAVATVTGGLGANAAADFAANKILTMPNWTNMSAIGVGSFISQAGATGGAANVTPTGSTGTTGGTALTAAQIPTITGELISNQGAGVYVADNATGSVVLGADISIPGDNTKNTILFTSTNTGGGSHTHPGGSLSMNPSSVYHPVFAGYWNMAI